MSKCCQKEQQQSFDLAVRLLKRGGVVAFPTETYYGLAVDPFCESAVSRLYELKIRPADKPLLLLIEKLEQLALIVERIPQQFLPLMEKYWPGPLTLIFPAKSSVSKIITGNTGTIGVRISPHPVARSLLVRMQGPLTATSANISGGEPAQTAAEVEKIFGSSVDLILDGGQSAAGLCSTIVGLQDDRLTLLRKGQVEPGLLL